MPKHFMAGNSQDGTAMLWDLAEGKKLYSLEAFETIHALCFSPNRYWLCAATDSAIKVCPLLSLPLFAGVFFLHARSMKLCPAYEGRKGRGIVIVTFEVKQSRSLISPHPSSPGLP